MHSTVISCRQAQENNILYSLFDGLAIRDPLLRNHQNEKGWVLNLLNSVIQQAFIRSLRAVLTIQVNVSGSSSNSALSKIQ